LDDSPLVGGGTSFGSGDLSSPTDDSPSFFRNPKLPYAFVRVCIYLVIGNVIGFGLRFVGSSIIGTGRALLDPVRLIVEEFIAAASMFGAAWIMSRLERQNFGAYGLPKRGAFGKFFWQGALFGFAEISVVIGVLAGFGYYRFGSIALHGDELLRWASFWALFFLLVGLYEEFSFRGYVQYQFARGAGFWIASVLLSLEFGARHLLNPGETWRGILGVVLIGLFWCLTLRRTGTLWFALGMHAVFDFAETFLYSVPDSGAVFPGHLSNATLTGPAWITGGTAGPEASVLDLAVILLFFLLFHWLYPAGRTPESAKDKDKMAA
jgi:membrane protease YdiL (CAAX protease family)